MFYGFQTARQGGSRNSQNSTDGNRGDPRRSNTQRHGQQSSTSYQGTDNRARFQGQGGTRPQNQRPDSSQSSSGFNRSQPGWSQNQNNTQRSQYEGTQRSGNRNGFVDRTGKLTRSSEKPPHLKPMKAPSGILWKPLPQHQDEIKIPVRPGQATQCEREISLRVNYFPLKIKLPDNIYHYVVDITEVIDENKVARKSTKPEIPTKPSQSKDEPGEKKVLPKHLRSVIHKKLVNQLREAFLNANPGQTIGIISDRSNALYSTKKLDRSVNLEQNVEIPVNEEESNGRHRTYRVVVAPTIEKVDTRGIQKSLDYMKDIPITADLEILDRVYNTLMKNLNCNRYVPIGKSSLICFEDSTSYRLGEGLLNFQGYNATIEITNGWKPFLNVHGEALR